MVKKIIKEILLSCIKSSKQGTRMNNGQLLRPILFGFFLLLISISKEIIAPPSSGHTTHTIPTGGGGGSTNPPIVPASQATGIYAEPSYITSATQMGQLLTIITQYINNSLGQINTTYSIPANGVTVQYGYLPIRAQEVPLQTVFQNFYNQIFSGTALPSTSAPAVSYPSIFNNLLSLFQSQSGGDDFGLIFVPAGGLYTGPLDLFNNVQSEIVKYVDLATKNITELNYATDDAINFVGNGSFFSTTPTSTVVGPNQASNSLTCPNAATGTQQSCVPLPTPPLPDSYVAQLNNFVNGQLFTPLSTAFTTFQSSQSASSSTISATVAQQNYTNAYNNYLYQVSNLLANWGYGVINQLASIYNPQIYLSGASSVHNPNADYLGIPNCALLDNYGALTITAVNQLALAAQSLNLSAVVKDISFQGTLTSSATGLSSSGQNFVVQLDDMIYTNLAQIAGYAAFRSLELAGQYSNGRAIPPTVSSNGSPTIVQNSTSAINPQQAAQNLSSTGALELQNKTVTQAPPSVDPSVIAQAVLESVMDAYQYFSLASKYYTVINNTLMGQFYASKSNSLQTLLSTWMVGIQAISNAPSPSSSAAALESYMADFRSAQSNFNTTAELFNQIGQSSLGLYLQRMSAQAGIIEYQEVLNATVIEYAPYISSLGGYINYANAEPIVSTDQWVSNVSNASQQETTFETVMSYIQQQVAGAQAVYSEELSFYDSLGVNATANDKQVAADLLATTEIFENLSSGLSILGYLTDLLGTNYATATSFPSVLDTIISSESLFIQALNQLQKADTLIAQATPGVLSYVQIQNIFANQDSGIYSLSTSDGLPLITTFYNLAYLHRARLCYHAGQILAAAQEPLALYLFWVSFTLYEELSLNDPNAQNSPYSWAYNNQSKVYNNTIAPYMNENLNLSSSLYSQAQALSSSLQTAQNSTSNSPLSALDISLMYQKIMKLYFTLFVAESDPNAFTAFVNDANSAISWYQSSIGQTVPYANLQLAMIYYQLYLITYSNNQTLDATSFSNAQAALVSFKTDNQIMPGSSSTPIIIPTEPTEAQFNQLSTTLELQANALLAIEQAKISQALLEAYYYLTPGTVQELDFSLLNVNFSEQLGTLYYNYASSLLASAKTNFNAGQSYNNTTNNETYSTIISTYQQAAQYFNQAGMAAQSLQAQQGISSAVAWEIYSWIIPLRMCNLATITNDPTSLGVIPSTWCQTDTQLIQSYTANPTWPDYVLNYSETLIPSSLISAAQPYLNKTVTTTDILTNLVIPLKEYIYNQALQLSGKVVNLQPFLTQDQIFATALLQGSVKASAGTVPLISSYSVITKIDPITNAIDYYLIGNNTPLSSMPRFAGEIETAFYYYSQGALPIFEPGTQPVNVSGQLLLPAPDETGVVSINAALFNVNYLAVLSCQSQLNQLLVNPTYTALTQLTPQQLLTMTSSENVSMLTTYNNFYNNQLNSVLIDLLANYQNTVCFAKTITSQPSLATFMQTQEVKAFIQWISIGKQFLFGDPTASDNMYKFYLSPLLNCKDEALALFLNGGVIESEALSLNNQLISLIGGVLENTGDILVTISTTFPTVNYPTSTSIYPIIPSGFGSLKKWQDAINYYSVALSEYTANYQLTAGTIPTYGAPSVSFANDTALRLHGKLSLATYNDAIYRLAIFGNNAFQECKCKLYSGPLAITTPATSTTASVTTTTNVSNVFETVAMAQIVELNSLWHQNLDLAINSSTSPVSQGNIVCNSVNGYPLSTSLFSGITFSTNIYGSYQGVAVQFTPLMIQFLAAASSQCSTETFNAGPGSLTCLPNAVQAGNCLQNQYLLQAISSLSLLASPGDSSNPAPLQSIQNLMDLANKNIETYNAVNVYLCGSFTQDATTEAITISQSGVFNSNPGFSTNDQIIAAGLTTNPVPLIYPALSIFENVETANGSNQSTEKILPIVFGSQLNPGPTTQSLQGGGNILSNGATLYTSTIEYWSSLLRFLGDLQAPINLWFGNPYAENFTPIDPATFFSWVNGLNIIAQNVYGNVYLPLYSGTDLYQQINIALSQLSQNNNSNANQYVG